MQSISIVIPTYRRPASALACLQSLLELDYPRELLEVVLVEDGAGDAPLRYEDLAPFLEPLRLRFLRQENAGPAAARNSGAAAATGTFLAFTDDDCRPAADWLRVLAAQFERTPDAVLGGQTRNALPNRVCSEASQVLLDYIYGYYLEKGDPFFASNNVALSRANFERIGGFDLGFAGAGGEDREFCTRCLAHDLRFVFLPDAIVHHHHDLSLRKFARQHFNYGRGAHVYHRAQVATGSGAIELEPLCFYSDLIRYPRRLPPSERVRFGSSLMVLSQAANAAGYFVERFGSSGQRAQADTAGDGAASSPGASSGSQNAQARLVAREAGGTWAANLLGVGCRYLAMLGAAHILKGKLYGDYTLSLAITGVMAVIAVLGLSPGLLPFLSRARQSGDEQEVRAVVRSAMLPVIVASLALTLVVYLLAPWAAQVLFKKPHLEQFLAPLSGLVGLGAITTVSLTLLQGFMAVKQRVWIERVVVTATIAAGMGVSWLFDLGIGGAVGSTLLGALAGLIAGVTLLRRRVSGAFHPSTPAAPLRVGALLGYSWPLLGTSMLAFLLLWTDVLVMGVLSGSAEVGVYGACARIAAIAMLAHESLGPVFVARLSDLHARDDWDGIRHLYLLTARWAMWPGLALAWSISIFGGDILGLFGEEFRAGTEILSVLCIGKALASSTGMTGRVLGITGRARLNLINMILLVGGNVLLNFLWIPIWGGIGAAAATSLCLILVRLLQVTQLRVLYGILPWSLKSLIPLVGISGLAALVYPMRAGVGGTWGWSVPFVLFMGASAALFFLTSIDEEDRAVWRSVRGRLGGGR